VNDVDALIDQAKKLKASLLEDIIDSQNSKLYSKRKWNLSLFLLAPQGNNDEYSKNSH